MEQTNEYQTTGKYFMITKKNRLQEHSKGDTCNA